MNTSVNNIEIMRQRLSSGQICIGTGITLSDPAVSELVGEIGYDFTWIDMEHTGLGHSAAKEHIMALRGSDTAPFVRVRQNDLNVIKPVLDLAPAGIIVPQVCSAQEAREVVRACRYPPAGARGFGPARGMRFGAMTQPDYLQKMVDDPIIVIQIEHARAVENLDEMLDVPQIDVYCLGLNDLSGSLGKLGQIEDPEVREAYETVAKKVTSAGRTLGISTFYSAETYARWRGLGITWLNLSADFANLFRAASDVLEATRGPV